MKRNGWHRLLFVLTSWSIASVTFAQAAEAAQCPGAPVSRLTPTYKGMVASGGTVNNVRRAPSIASEILSTLAPDSVFDVLQGPRCADGFAWWEVSTGSSYGWTAEGSGSQYFLEPYYPEALATEDAGTVSVDYGDIHFHFDNSIASGISVENLPAVSRPSDGLTWGSAPTGIGFTLFDGSERQNFPRSTIHLYPAIEFSSFNEIASQRIAALKSLIADETASQVTEIPEVPELADQVQALRAGIRYLNLADGGKGVRFITYYTLLRYPVSNEVLKYEFRGFSADNRHYITAEIGIRASILPDVIRDPELTGKFTASSFQDYLGDITQKLNDLGADHFTPNLDQLDAMLESITFSAAQ